MPKFLLTLALMFTLIGVQAAEDPAHTELRALLKGLETAVNTERYGDLTQYFHENMRVTTINQEVLSSPKDIAPYFDKWFGTAGFLKKVEMTLTADDLTQFYEDGMLGVVRGAGAENYYLADNRYFEMKTRWTATVIKDTDGSWRILTLHIGTNFLDNPILAKAEQSLLTAAIGGGIAGLILGVVIILVVRRRKT
jgi:ketosteroid isomerase-like protein